MAIPVPAALAPPVVPTPSGALPAVRLAVDLAVDVVVNAVRAGQRPDQRWIGQHGPRLLQASKDRSGAVLDPKHLVQGEPRRAVDPTTEVVLRKPVLVVRSILCRPDESCLGEPVLSEVKADTERELVLDLGVPEQHQFVQSRWLFPTGVRLETKQPRRAVDEVARMWLPLGHGPKVVRRRGCPP